MDPLTTDVVLFLLGYPLSILSEVSFDFLKEKFRKYRPEPLKALFVKSFFLALDSNKKNLDKIGQRAIAHIEKIVRADDEKLFYILKQALGDDYLKVFELRSMGVKEKMVELFSDEFDLPNNVLAKAVVFDCFNQYEVSFFSELTEKEGIHFLINILRKLNSDIVKQSDIEELKNFIVNNISIDEKDETNELKKFFYNELKDPSSEYFSDSIVDYMASLKKTVEKLTKDQYQIIHHLRYKKRVTISGCAGSGKTLLAAEKAIRMDSAGIKTLILCHNPHLAEHIQNLVFASGVHVFDISNFVNMVIGKDLIDMNKWNKYVEPLNEEIEMAFDKLGELKWDYEAVIVDEGQDFRELWWLLIEAILENSKDKILYIFYDDNQTLMPFRSRYPIEESPISMSKNCRNAGNIFEIVKRFHPDSPLVSQFLTNDGIAKLTDFNDSNLESRLGKALIDANLYARPSQIKIITNEGSVEKSPINGIKFSSQEWNWVVTNDLIWLRKMAVNEINKLKINRGILAIEHDYKFSYHELDEHLEIPSLSFSISPSQNDILLVSEYAKKLLPILDGIENTSTYFISRGGKLYLVSRKLDGTIKFANARSKAFFYSNRNWAESLNSLGVATTIVPASSDLNLDENTLPLYSIDMFKGLEADAIILFINSINTDLEKELYIGSSRAIGYLHIVINASVLAKISKLNGISDL